MDKFDGVAAVAADSESEPVNIAESDADTDTAYIDKLMLHIAWQYLPLV